MPSQFIKKISVKNCYGKVSAADAPMDILQVVGIATGSRTGESTYGPWVSLRGTFQATNLQTGEVFRGSECFLPDIGVDMVLVALNSKDAQAVEFAVNVSIKKSESPIGYEYTVTPLMKLQENDPLAALANRLEAPGKEVRAKNGKPNGKPK